MQLFYLNNIDSEIELTTEESRHVTKVLRKKHGDILSLTDGNGVSYKAEITDSNIKRCKLKIISHKTKEKQHNYQLHIAIAPTKNTDRFEWFLEKATEIGIDEITPIICEKSERKKIKIERCNRILITAIKQSLKFHIPKLNEVTSFKELIKKEHPGNKYIAHCNNTEKKELRAMNTKNRTIILIGPEGDFSSKEIKESLKNNFKSVTLGSSRLRTETAGIVAVNTVAVNN